MIQLCDQTYQYPIHLLQGSDYVKGLLSFEEHQRKHWHQSQEEPQSQFHLDLSDWSSKAFFLIMEHMLMASTQVYSQPYQHSWFIRNRITKDNVVEVEQLADYLLYEPLRVIRLELTYSIRDMQGIQEDPTIKLHNHTWLESKVGDKLGDNQLSKPVKFQFPREQCQAICKVTAIELQMSIGRIHVDYRSEVDLDIHLVLINDGMVSIPFGLGWDMYRGQNENALLTIQKQDGTIGSSLQSNDLK